MPHSNTNPAPSGLPPELQDTYVETRDVADLLHVSPKTVTRWAKQGKLPCSRTLGGHRRFPLAGVWPIAAGLASGNTLPDPRQWLAQRKRERRAKRERARST